jgi:hypothetical protein
MEAVAARNSFETICWRRKGKDGWQEKAIEAFAGLSHDYCPDLYRQAMPGCGPTPISEGPMARQQPGPQLINHDGIGISTAIRKRDLIPSALVSVDTGTSDLQEY